MREKLQRSQSYENCANKKIVLKKRSKSCDKKYMDTVSINIEKLRNNEKNKRLSIENYFKVLKGTKTKNIEKKNIKNVNDIKTTEKNVKINGERKSKKTK